MMMKKQVAIVITVVAFTFYPKILSANFTDDTSYKDKYSWEFSDSDQKKMAAGMLMWGFFLAVASALISAFIPNSTSDASTSSSSSSSSDLL